MNARGAGTFCAVDCPDAATRDAVVTASRNKGQYGAPGLLAAKSLVGFHLGGCGDQSIRFRPALIFQLSHASMFLDGFEKVLSEKAS